MTVSSSSGISSQAHDVKTAAESLLDLHRRAEEWRHIANEIVTVDPGDLRKRTRKCSILSQTAARPPTVGVFGESQVGKSFLISRLTGSQAGVLIKDPTVNDGAEEQPWTEQSLASGGLSFIDWINAQAGLESTALVCRFTRKPVDVPRRRGVFVLRLMTHEDLLAALSVGFLAEVPSDAHQAELYDEARAVIEQIGDGKHTPGSVARLEDLEAAWRFVSAQYDTDPYVSALDDAGFSELLCDLIKSGHPPSGASWVHLVGLLWGVGRNPVLDELYQRLAARLGEFEGALAVEVPVAAVLKHGQVPLTDVSLLEQVFEDGEKIQVWIQQPDGAENSINVSRSELSALALELVLPVVRGSGESLTLLDHADILDFPGARADTRNAIVKPSDHVAAQSTALAVLRRGKLTRVFSTLSERREINILCLAAKAGNLEAPASVTRLLRHWFANRAHTDKPDLFVAITRCDEVLKEYPNARWPMGTQGLGGFIDEVKRKYASSAVDFDWMDRFPPDHKPFKNMYFIYNPAKVSMGTQWENVPAIREHVLSHPAVCAHMADPGAKVDALVGGHGGVNCLAEAILEAVVRHDKFRRIGVEVADLRDNLIAILEPHFVDSEQNGGRANPRAEALRDIEAVANATAHNLDSGRNTGRNVIAILLESMRMPPSILSTEFRKLERSHGALDASISSHSLSRQDFVDAVRVAWSKAVAAKFSDDRFQSELRDLGISGDILQSLLRGWTQAVTQDWMNEVMAEALDPYFDSPAGPTNLLGGLLNAGQWAWNRQLVSLGSPLPPPPSVLLPPKLSPPESPSWSWILDHWREVLPVVYAGGQPPVGWNSQLGQILADLRLVEISA
jgi:hypothetical protein